MWETIVAILGAVGAFLTYILEKKKRLPLENKVKQANIEKKELIDKYARTLGRAKTLQKVVAKQREKLYEKMGTDELVDAWNSGVLDDDPEDPSNNGTN